MDKGSQGCIYSLRICKVQRRGNNLAVEKPNLKAYTGSVDFPTGYSPSEMYSNEGLFDAGT